MLNLQEYSTDVELVSGILTSVLSPITVTANVLLLATLWKNSSSYFRTPTMYFIMGLGATDLTTGLLVEPIKAFCSLDFYLRNRRRTAVCSTMAENVVDIVLPATANSSFLIVLALSLSQYVAVGWPCSFASVVSVKSAKVSVVIAWGYSLSFSLVQLFWGGAEDSAKKILARVDLYVHSTAVSIALVIVYVLMLKALCNHIRHRQRTCSVESRQTRDISIKLNSSESHEPKLQRAPRVRMMESKFIKVNLILIFILLLSTIPMNVVKYVTLSWKSDSHLSLAKSARLEIARKVTDDVLLVKFALDAFVYVWRLPRYRAALLHNLTDCC